VRSGDLVGEITGPGDLAQAGDYLDVIRAVLGTFWEELPHRRFSLSCGTQVPAQSGLAGSTSLLVALTGAVLRFIGRPLSPWEVAEQVHRIEWGVMGTACGYQDFHIEVFGGLNYMDFRRKETLGATGQEPWATIEPLLPYVPELPFLLASTGVERNSGAVHRPVRQRWEEGDPEVVEAYLRITHLAAEGKKALLRGDWPALGALMNENHAIQQSLGSSHPTCDALIDAARAAGAHGAKLAGAGNGGTIIALTTDPEALGHRLKEAGAFRLITPKPGAGLLVSGEMA
jgi:galactokinase/mevalonate kinase-like predicted kinase